MSLDNIIQEKENIKKIAFIKRIQIININKKRRSKIRDFNDRFPGTQTIAFRNWPEATLFPHPYHPR